MLNKRSTRSKRALPDHVITQAIVGPSVSRFNCSTLIMPGEEGASDEDGEGVDERIGHQVDLVVVIAVA